MKRHGFSGLPASHGAHRVHRSPGSIGACATPSRVFRGTRMAGRMGGEKVTTLNLTVVSGRRRARPGPRPGRGPRPQGWPRGHPRRREGRSTDMADHRDQVRHRHEGRHGRARRRHVRRRAQHRRDAPGRHRPARRPPPRHAVHQDPRRGAGRRRQAVEAEGHRPGPRGLQPAAALDRRRRGPRPQAPLLRAAHAQEDDPPRARAAPCPTGRLGARCWSSTGASTRRAPRPPWQPSPPTAPRGPACSSSCGPRTTPSGRASATCDKVHICDIDELNAYDVLVSDWLVFTPDTLPVDKPVTRGQAHHGGGRREGPPRRHHRARS